MSDEEEEPREALDNSMDMGGGVRAKGACVNSNKEGPCWSPPPLYGAVTRCIGLCRSHMYACSMEGALGARETLLKADRGGPICVLSVVGPSSRQMGEPVYALRVGASAVHV